MSSKKSSLLLIGGDSSSSKLDIAEKNVSFNVTLIFLQRVMQKAGFNHKEREIDSVQLIHFMHLGVVKVGKELHRLKGKISGQLTEKESSVFKKFSSEAHKAVIDEKINTALDLLCSNVISDLKEIMIFAKYEKHELEKNHESFIEMYSFSFITLAELCTRYISRFSYASLARHQDSEKLQENQTLTSLLDPLTSINLIKKTRKFRILLVSTLQGKFALKLLSSRYHTRKYKDQMINEYRISQTLSHQSHRKCLRRLRYRGKDALLMEWVQGDSLSNKKGQIQLQEFLTLARDIVTSLLAMHRVRLCHLNLSINHVIIPRNSTGQLKVIGHGHSMKFSQVHFNSFNKEILEKEVNYISPELTGLNGRTTDYRSDFYSLGVVFYQLLTGKLPFDNTHLLKLVQSHILENPQFEHNINPEIPKPIIEMISKLMQKNADQRYQSAGSILHDIELMLAEVNSTEGMNLIKLAQYDKPEFFLLPQKLYGRSAAYTELLEMIESSRNDSLKIVFLSGNSGTGKSALLLELYKPILKNNGIRLSGKFEKSTSRPLSPLLNAIQIFCDFMMLMEATTVEFFKVAIQKAVGEEGSLLTELIPDLTKLIGHQPKIHAIFGKEAKNRLYYVLLSFFKAICSSSHQIVLILDDCQWLDITTYKFLSWLICDKSIKNLLLIFSYRSDEIKDNKSLLSLIKCVQESKVQQTRIELRNFDIETVNEIISDIFQIPIFEAYSLSFSVFDITNGNPIYLTQLLKVLHEKNFIYFSNESMKWVWKEQILGGKDYSSNLQDLFRTRISSCGDQVKKILKVASILGSPFSLSLLNVILSSSNAAEIALASGMIVQNCGIGRFSHDAIEFAAYSMLPVERSKLYFYIGMKLWKELTQEKLEDNILIVVKLLNHSWNLFEGNGENHKIASLFLKAAKKCMILTAFDKALEILEVGLKILGTDCWDKHYSLCLRMYNLASEAAYCASDEAKFNIFVNEISCKATEPSHLLNSTYLKVRSSNDKKECKKAFETGLSILKQIGIHFEFGNNNLAMIDVMDTLVKFSHEDILKMKKMEDEKLLGVVRILSSMTISAYFLDPQQLLSLAIKFIQLTLSYGVSQYTCVAFTGLSFSLSIRGDKSCYEYGKLALEFLNMHGSKEFAPNIYATFYGGIYFWFNHIEPCLLPLLQGYRISFEVGNLEYSMLCANTYAPYAFYSGKNLKDLIEELEIFNDQLIKKTEMFLSTYQSTLHLTNESTKNPNILIGSEFDIEDYLSKEHLAIGRVRCCTYCLYLGYLFHDFSSASNFVEICKPDMIRMKGTYFYPIFILYSGLLFLAQLSKSNNKSDSLEYADECIESLQEFSRSSPNNFENKVHLLLAEKATLKNEKSVAIFHFEKSILLAKRNCFINEEALACERFGIFLRRDSANDGVNYLIDAAQCYRAWGAERKIKHLLELFPFLLENQNSSLSLHNLTVNFKDESDTAVSLLTESTFPVANATESRKRLRSK